MSKQRLTKWFSADVSPARIGVYQVFDSVAPNGYAYWDGHKFGFRTWTKYDKKKNVSVRKAFDMRTEETCLPARIKWRGLAEKP